MTSTDSARRLADMETAAEWLARLHADDCGERDRSAFGDWLRESESHRSAFEAVTRAFDASGAVGRRWLNQDAAEARAAQEEALRPAHAGASRRMVLASVGAAVIGAGTIGWQTAYAGGVETGFAERRSVRLDDGSTVRLDAESAIRTPWLSSRTIEMRKGRISLAAVPDSGREFLVKAPSHQISGSGMDLDISLGGAGLTVSVLHGSVRVTGSGRPAVELRDGDRLSPDGAVDRPSMARLLAWREGRLVFENTTLAEACEELNRYDRMRLRPDPQAAQMSVSGTFAMGQNASFGKAMEELLAVRAVEGNGEIALQAAAADIE